MRHWFIDSDGVLADLEAFGMRLLAPHVPEGDPPLCCISDFEERYGTKEFWRHLDGSDCFRNCPPMPSAHRLIDELAYQGIVPTVLTKYGMNREHGDETPHSMHVVSKLDWLTKYGMNREYGDETPHSMHIVSKLDWFRKHFPQLNVIVCHGRKADYANRGDVLIDDWIKHADPWIAKGGVFIHHKDFDSTMRVVRTVLGDSWRSRR